MAGPGEVPQSSVLPVGWGACADPADGVRVLRTSDGEKLWEFDAGNGFTSSAAVADGAIVLPSGDGTIWCFGGGDIP